MYMPQGMSALLPSKLHKCSQYFDFLRGFCDLDLTLVVRSWQIGIGTVLQTIKTRFDQTATPKVM